MVRQSAHESSVTFAVHVVPRASRTRIAGEHDGALKVYITAAPVAGAANRELIRVLAKSLKLPQNAIEIISGANARRKVVRARGTSATLVEQLKNTN